ncbi:MAG: hypothetical protein WD273_11895 [Trueperaceae bacterium]
MNDVSKFGPLGEGEESRPLTVDLTRIDIRRGAINLPRRFYGVLPEGDLQASDTVAGRELMVTFHSPRQLEGLGPFFEEHDLRPNDAVSIALTDGLRLTPIIRERRQSTSAQSPSLGSPSMASPSMASVTAQEDQRNEVREAAPENSRRREPSQRDQASGPSKAPATAAYLAPPVPEIKGGWQNVLHDPIQRRGQAARAVEPLDLDFDPDSGNRQDEREERRQTESRQSLKEPAIDVGGGEEWHRSPRDLSRPAAEQRRGEFEERPDETQRRPSGTPRDAQRQAPLAPKQEQRSEPQERRQDAELEPVLLGASSSEGDLSGRISRYLQDPATPAIVRAASVAEALRLPLDAVQHGLAEVARHSEGAVAPIRDDVYLVKRSR